MTQSHLSNRSWIKGLLVIVLVVFVIACIMFVYSMKQAQAPKLVEDSPVVQKTNDTFLKAEVDTPQTTSVAPVPTKPDGKFVTGLENLPRSLKDTDVDGEIIIDDKKNLYVTNGLRRLFDYFLSARGQESDEDIIARIEAYIRARVPEPAQTQAITVLHQYIAYLKELSNIEEAGGKTPEQIDIDLIEQQQQQVASIQKRYFDKNTITAFFGVSMAYDNYNIKLFKIQKDTSLTPDQRKLAEQQALEEIPDEQLKSQIKEQKNYATLFAETKKLKSQNASADEIRQLREKMVGKAAADRLEQVDHKQEQWQKRVQNYLNEKTRIQNSALNDYDKNLSIQQLKHRGFTELEQKRLLAYEQLGKASID